MQFRTRAIHVGQGHDPATGAVVPPIHLASTFVQPDASMTAAYDYARTGSPTRHAFEKTLADLELQTELDLCYPNPIIKAFYDACVASGKKIAFISYMYLPPLQIAQMLINCGFDPQNLFVSSDVGLCKGTCRVHFQ